MIGIFPSNILIIYKLKRLESKHLVLHYVKSIFGLHLLLEINYYSFDIFKKLGNTFFLIKHFLVEFILQTVFYKKV